MMRACPSRGIKQMVETSRRLELRPVSAGRAHRPVAQIQAHGDHFGLTWIGKTNAPWPPVGVTAHGAYFAAAHIAKGSIATACAQDLHDAVGDITLRNTIKRYAHSSTTQHDATLADIDRLPVDELASALNRLQCWPPGGDAALPKKCAA